MNIDLHYKDGSVVGLQVDGELQELAIVNADGDYFVFVGFAPGTMSTAKFFQCAAPLQVSLKAATLPEQPKPLPKRKFFGKSKGQDNG